MYKHLTLKDRFTLATLLLADYDHYEIADFLGVSPATITREVDRNSRPNGVYDPRYAHMLAKLRRQQSKIGCRKIENNPDLEKYIEARLSPLVSPEVIAQDEDVCFQTIYTWVNRSRNDLRIRLPQHGKKRRRYGTKRSVKQGWTRHVRQIEERPVGAKNRSRVGHYEGDTVKLKGGALLTHTDRKSRFEIVYPVISEEAEHAFKAICKDQNLSCAKSITYDRGSTFAWWQMIEKEIGTKVYFAHAHHPWERGTNENSNQRLRRIFPKGTKYSSINHETLSQVVWTMNHTKRKCLNWRTPCQVFGKCCTSS